MIVKELIEKLSSCNQDLPVVYPEPQLTEITIVD